jgi:hypothetical protein
VQPVFKLSHGAQYITGSCGCQIGPTTFAIAPWHVLVYIVRSDEWGRVRRKNKRSTSSLYSTFPQMSDYDPKAAAIGQTRQYVEASYIHSQKPTPAENPVSPGYEWPNRCWELLHEPAVESSNQYTLRVTYYNWEDGGSFGASGADEITVLVDFANGSQVVSCFQAGTVRFFYPPDELEDGGE